MAATKEQLVAEILRLADQHWVSSQEAILLSKLGPLLHEKYPDYKSTLNGQSLRNFIINEASDLSIAQHSAIFAKVGVYPAKQNFSYDTSPVEAKSSPTDADKVKASRRAFYTFIKAISELPEDDIKDLHIPTKVIVRLLEGK